MNSLYAYARLNELEMRELSTYASRYLAMIRNMLYAYAPNTAEDVLWSYASIIHNMLNAHAQWKGDTNTYFYFDNSVMHSAILALMDVCRNQSESN